MAIEDAAQYEQDVVSEVRAMFENWRSHHIHEVRLEGSYPDTKLVIDYQDPRQLRPVRTMEWELWGPEFHSHLGDEPPQGVATLVFAHLIES